MKVIAQINSQTFQAAGVDPEQIRKAVEAAAAQIVKLAETSISRKQAEFDKLKREATAVLGKLQKLLSDEGVTVSVDVKHNEPFTVSAPVRPPARARPAVEASSNGSLPNGELLILKAIAQYPDGADRKQLTILTGYKRSTRDAYIQRLREREYINTVGNRESDVDRFGSQAAQTA